MDRKYEGCFEPEVDENVQVYDNLEFTYGAVLPKRYKIETPIRDQRYSNLCVSFSGSAMAYADAMVKYGKSNLLSPTFTQKLCKDIDNRPKETGTTIQSFCKVITKYGICDESLYPFDEKRNANTFDFPTITQAMYDNALKNKAKSYARITNLQKVKECIVNEHGCIIGMRIFENFDKDEQGIILPPPKTMNAKIRGNHAMYICGYDDEATLKACNGVTYTGFFIIQDSYTEEAGSYGYRYLPYDLFKATGYYSKDTLVNEVWCTYDNSNLKNPNYWQEYQAKIEDIMNVKENKHTVCMYIGSDTMWCDGEILTMVAPPMVINGTTLVPLVALSQAFPELFVSYDNTTKTVSVRKDNVTYYMKSGDCNIYATDGSVAYTSLVPITIQNGRTYLPIRAIAEVFGYTVLYDNTLKKVTIIG